MKLLIDMNLSPRWIRVLTDAGSGIPHYPVNDFCELKIVCGDDFMVFHFQHRVLQVPVPS